MSDPTSIRNIPARRLIAALECDGFRRTHQTGSHARFRRGERRVMVAIHASGTTIPIGTLHRIIKDAGWTDDDLRRLRLLR